MLGQTIIQFPVADAKTPADGLARAERFIKEFKDDGLIVPAVAPHALYTQRRDDAAGGARRWPRKYGVPVHHSSGRDGGRSQDRARAASGCTPAALSRIDRLLGAADACGARRLGDRRRHRDSEAARRRRVAQPREQHEAGQRHGAGREIPGRRRRARPRHRRRRQQQRSRHVRGDAPGVVSRQAATARSDAPFRRRRRSTWRRSAARARWAWSSTIGSLEAGKRADLITVSMARRGRRRCTIRCRTSSTSRAATTCGRRSSTARC